jgi:pimeloyl-ACP methyl ester carboxylesterase
MPATLRLPQISTNVRLVASRLLFPELAGAWAERLFLTPPKAEEAASSALDLIDAREGWVVHKGRHVMTWRWGAADAPAVVLAHGWGGHAAQMRAFVFPLLSAGFRVVAYDQPAHGLSEGKLTGLPDFAEVLGEIAAHYGDVRAVIGHSLGATAAVMAHAWNRLDVDRIVLISPASDLVGYSRRFARWHWMPEPLRRAMQGAIEERYGIRWEELELKRVAPRLAASALVIHDRDDRTVPWKQGAAVAQYWRGARLVTTQGLGHGRILQDEAVVGAAATFITGL